MVINPTEFPGLKLINNNRILDNRGWFEKKFQSILLSELNMQVKEVYASHSARGVLRGLHFQSSANAQPKLVTCISGSFIDIAVDLRADLPTFGKVFIHEINSRNPISVYVPGEFAHGIYSLEENTIMLNMAGAIYSPGNEGGILWSSIPELAFINDPILSEKDANLPTLTEVISAL